MLVQRFEPQGRRFTNGRYYYCYYDACLSELTSSRNVYFVYIIHLRTGELWFMMHVCQNLLNSGISAVSDLFI